MPSSVATNKLLQRNKKKDLLTSVRPQNRRQDFRGMSERAIPAAKVICKFGAVATTVAAPVVWDG